jgi:hypothetical protein
MGALDQPVMATHGYFFFNLLNDGFYDWGLHSLHLLDPTDPPLLFIYVGRN